MATRTILAPDLGKDKSVARLCDGDPAAARFQCLSAGRAELAWLIDHQRPSSFRRGPWAAGSTTSGGNVTSPLGSPLVYSRALSPTRLSR